MKVFSIAAIASFVLPVLADYGLAEVYELSLANSMSSDERFKTEFTASGSAVLTNSGPGGRAQISLTELGRPNQRGSVAANARVSSKDFISEISIGVYGPVLPGGGFGMFFTPQPYQGGPVYGMKDSWNGLALILDSVIGNDGEGHLHVHDNTGTQYASLDANQVEKDALALCKLKYRNTGAPVKITTYYIGGKLKVEINGHKCFEERPVAIPENPYFSISAASSEGPDTFEIYSLKTYRVDPNGVGGERKEEPPVQQQQQQQQQQQAETKPHQDQAQANQQQQQGQQQALQTHDFATSDHINSITDKLVALEEKLESFTALKQLSSLSNDILVLNNRLGVIDQKMKEMEVDQREHVRERAQDTKNHLSNELSQIKQQLNVVSQNFDHLTRSNSDTLRDQIKNQFTDFAKSSPNVWIPLVIVIAAQSAAFFLYVRSRGKYEKLL